MASSKRKSQTASSVLSKKKVEKLAQNWQRCRQEELPGLFYAYDEVEHQSERIVTYRLAGDPLKDFYESIPAKKAFKLIVHLGLQADHYPESIPESPAFMLLIQSSVKSSDWQEGCFPMKWEANSRFSKGAEDDSSSEKNAIPAAGAYLFVQSWLETPESLLAVPFTAVSHVLGRRVKAYVFSPTESRSIYDDMTRSMASNMPCVDIHLGRGLAVYDHPFSFRPVIEVKNAVDPKNPGSVARNATGLTNDDGDSFYDFGAPIPPSHP